MNGWTVFGGLLYLWALAVGVTASAADGPSYSLRDGDTVVFYGDSITEQNLYTQWVEFYTVTRFPGMRVHFYGAGMGGDRVTGGAAGPIDERLARDVFPHKPTVVTVMLGMNDGSYRPTTEEIESTYTKGFEHLLASLESNAPGVRVTLLGPSPFDDVTRPAGFPGGYNAVMQHFADLDAGLASRHHAAFANLNPATVEALRKALALDPLVAKLILPDRVHPDTIAHWVMAESLLKGWNAPALVSSVSIDAKAGTLGDARNATVDQIAREKDAVSWTSTEAALPLPFSADNAVQALMLQITDIQQQLNQEPLRVTGLEPGDYAVTIDGSKVGTFAAEELSKGINLADFPTPMRGQSQRVAWLVRDRDNAHFIHMRMQMKNRDTGLLTGKQDVMDAYENYLEDEEYKTAAPVPHVFRVSRVTLP